MSCVGKPLGDTVLFFGCRHKAEDYIYQDEIEQYHNEGTISHLFVAFSRDQVQYIYILLDTICAFMIVMNHPLISSF